MLWFLVRRLTATILVVVAVTILTFGILHLAPGTGPVLILKYVFIGIEEVPTDEEIAAVIERFNLATPLYVQYWLWLREVLHGDLGRSYVYGIPVSQLLYLKLPATVLLACTSVVVAMGIALPLGILSAVKRNTLTDHLLRFMALCSVSMPGFWLGLIMIILFSLKMNLFPVAGFGKLSHLVLPALTLAAGMAGVVMRVMRASLLEVLSQDYIIMARAKGLSGFGIIGKHALRNALLPVITLSGLHLGHLLGGAVIVETVFAWPGIGRLLFDAILARDLPLIQGCVLVIATAYAFVNLLVDMSYAWMNPRIRYGREQHG